MLLAFFLQTSRTITAILSDWAENRPQWNELSQNL